ncbi:MAG: hypothetical protein OXI38_09100 [Bacteroidota bacterium]|nr:hypothetical protein [Bacteroidota bacterium]
MLSEGWDAKTVTHIMGLRAFSSQLLCEQAVGRGLRRTTYEVGPDGQLPPEHVNVFGIPFAFLPHEVQPAIGPQPPATAIHPVEERVRYAITWPKVQRIDYALRTRMTLNLDALEPLFLDAAGTILTAEIAPVIDSKPEMSLLEIVGDAQIQRVAQQLRTQRLVLEAALDICDKQTGQWGGGKAFQVAQVVRIVESVIASDKVRVTPAAFEASPLRRKVTIALNMGCLVEHLQDCIRSESIEMTALEIDPAYKHGSTNRMRTWYTRRRYGKPKKCHINYCVYDSELERREAVFLDRSDSVEAWVKNDHLDFEITYRFQGIVRKYRPDFIVRLTSGDHLILEVKGDKRDDDDAKWGAMREWTEAVTGDGQYGCWHFGVSRQAGDILDCIAKIVTR